MGHMGLSFGVAVLLQLLVPCFTMLIQRYYNVKGNTARKYQNHQLHYRGKPYQILSCPSKHMTSKGRWVLVDFSSRRHITNIQRHSDVKMKRLINVGF